MYFYVGLPLSSDLACTPALYSRDGCLAAVCHICGFSVTCCEISVTCRGVNARGLMAAALTRQANKVLEIHPRCTVELSSH